MIETAKEKNNRPKITYRQSAMEDLDLEDGSFDIVLSSLVISLMSKILKAVVKNSPLADTGGYFTFSVEHPVFTAYGSQDWYYDEEGNILHFPVDNYYYEGSGTPSFLESM